LTVHAFYTANLFESEEAPPSRGFYLHDSINPPETTKRFNADRLVNAFFKTTMRFFIFSLLPV
jgi:hypothetical protein